jgi:16S rRNA (guanine527-N7)-methyltransferase
VETLAAGAAALGLPLSAAQRAAFVRYRERLLAWNRRVNLTAIVEPAEVETRHFLDSLTCAAPLLARWGEAARVPPLRCVDVGSGGGFPGVPLKLMLPQLHLTLLESTAKKVEFLTYLVADLALEDVDVDCARAETQAQSPAHRESYDVTFARALAPLPTLLELTLPFLRLGGVLVAPRKGQIAADIASAAGAINILGGGPPSCVPVTVPPLADGRVLVVVDKAGPTPPGYPRRAGIPAKRPLIQR